MPLDCANGLAIGGVNRPGSAADGRQAARSGAVLQQLRQRRVGGHHLAGRQIVVGSTVLAFSPLYHDGAAEEQVALQAAGRSDDEDGAHPAGDRHLQHQRRRGSADGDPRQRHRDAGYLAHGARASAARAAVAGSAIRRPGSFQHAVIGRLLKGRHQHRRQHVVLRRQPVLAAAEFQRHVRRHQRLRGVKRPAHAQGDSSPSTTRSPSRTGSNSPLPTRNLAATRVLHRQRLTVVKFAILPLVWLIGSQVGKVDL